jgi:hypothetical protein
MALLALLLPLFVVDMMAVLSPGPAFVVVTPFWG